MRNHSSQYHSAWSALRPLRRLPSYLGVFIIIFSVHEIFSEGFILVNLGKANSATDIIEGVVAS